MGNIRFIRVRGRIVPLRQDSAAGKGVPYRNERKALGYAAASGTARSVALTAARVRAPKMFLAAAIGSTVLGTMSLYHSVKGGVQRGNTSIGKAGAILGNVVAASIVNSTAKVLTDRSMLDVLRGAAVASKAAASKVKSWRYGVGRVYQEQGPSTRFNFARLLNPKKALPAK